MSYESIRQWCNRFGLDYAKRLRKRRGPGGDCWFLDEVTVSIQGRRQYLWRAVDQDGDVLDILLQSRKDKRAATRFFRKRNYSPVSEETTWAVCEGSVFGRDAKAKPTGRYLRRLPEQIAHVG